YLTAVSALCPFVAVLGARRGRLRDWNLFVVLPLIAVLEWPAIAQWSRCWNGQELELEAPTLLVYGVVLLMSVGNFLFTRFGFASFAWMVGWGLEVSEMGFSLPTYWTIRVLVGMTVIFFWLYLGYAARRTPNGIGRDRVWFDFHDWFGLVWAIRVSARIDGVAEREQWTWRLTQEGWLPASCETPQADSPPVDPRVDHTVRWLLKPFVDPEWIDERLNAARPPSQEPI
ncbi:MAG: hypothetical protein IAG10_19145, partial [Planctomycetaceae bacterium]|nr:hypothetical protein [Planctomycetaceae bacterium]